MDMKTYEEVLKEVLETKDPREAMIKIIMGWKEAKLGLTAIIEMMEAYMKKYGVEDYEMAYYPNGERVVSPEMFQ